MTSQPITIPAGRVDRYTYADWLRDLVTRNEYPKAHGNRGSAEARARRQAARKQVVNLEVEMEYE